MSGCVQNTPSIKLSVSNGILEADVKLSAQVGNQLSILSDGLFSSGAPSGAVIPFAGANAPAGWLIADGSPVSRTIYAQLFSAIGTAYGVGDGSTTFNLPDCRGRTIAGWASAGGHTDVSTLGGNDGAALATRRPKHLHTVTDPGHGHGITDPGHFHTRGFELGGANTVDSTAHYSIDTINTGTSTTGITVNSAATGISVGPASSPTDTPSYLVLNFIVKT